MMDICISSISDTSLLMYISDQCVAEACDRDCK